MYIEDEGDTRERRNRARTNSDSGKRGHMTYITLGYNSSETVIPWMNASKGQINLVNQRIDT